MPQGVAPEPLLQIGELLPDHFTGATLEVLHSGGDTCFGWELQEHMNVIREDLEFMKVPLVDARTLKPQLHQPAAERTMDHFAAILRDEDDVVEVAVDGMGTVPEDGWLCHSPIVPHWEQRFRLSPGLKAGACVRKGSINFDTVLTTLEREAPFFKLAFPDLPTGTVHKRAAQIRG